MSNFEKRLQQRREYDRKRYGNTRIFKGFNLSVSDDEDLIEFLDSVDNVTETIKEALRLYMSSYH